MIFVFLIDLYLIDDRKMKMLQYYAKQGNDLTIFNYYQYIYNYEVLYT